MSLLLDTELFVGCRTHELLGFRVDATRQSIPVVLLDSIREVTSRIETHAIEVDSHVSRPGRAHG
jgi:hypothetical protein